MKAYTLLLLFPVALPVLAPAQTRDRSELGGRVLDETGGVLPGVLLALRNEATGHEHRSVSQETGDFLFSFVQPGSYMLSAQFPGFARAKVEGLRLDANQRLDYELRLKVGTPDTVLQVTADANRVDAAGATVRDRIDGQDLAELPVLTGITGRSLLTQVPLLFPGASPYRPLGTSDSLGSGVSINGSPVGGIGFYIDGVDNNFLVAIDQGAATVGPNPDALEEFSAVLHNYGAEAGGHQSQIHWRTKGGGNRLHGQARAIRLDPDLSARDFFDTARRSSWTTTAFGFQLSGPLVLPRLYDGRNRTFFMADVESTRSRYETPARTVVFSDPNRNGDFSDLPSSLRPKDPATAQPFPDGRIPATRILPQSRFYIDELVPRASEASEITGTYVYRPFGTSVTSRVDHQFSGFDTISASVFVNPSDRRDIPLAPIGTTTRQAERGENLAANYTRMLSPHLVNSFTFGRTHVFFHYVQGGKQGLDLARQGYSIRTATSGPSGLPNVSLNSTSFKPFGGQRFNEISTYSWKDDLALSRGRYAVKLGTEARWLRAGAFETFAAAPSFAFRSTNPAGTGNDLADFLLGIPVSYSQGTDAENQHSRVFTAFYFQADVKLRPNVTLNMGLRYEVNGVATDRDGRATAFRPGAKSLVFPNAPASVLFGGDTELGNITPPDHDNVAPRFGIAYSPGFGEGLGRRIFGGPGRTSVRAGYGVFYVLGRTVGVYEVAYLPPWYFSAVRNRSQLDASGGDFRNPWGRESNPFLDDLASRPFSLPLQGVPFVDPGVRDAYEHQWSLSLQRELPSRVLVELGYLGSRSLSLLRGYEANPGLLTPDANLSNVDGRRSYRELGGVSGYVSDGVSDYQALQASVARRLAGWLNLNAHYVWSKTLDNATGSCALCIADRDASPWGRADSDRRHNFVGYAVYELPRFRRVRLLDRVLSGWQLTPVVTLRSGLPFLVRNQWDSTLRGTTNGFPDLVGPFVEQNPRQILTFTLPNGRTVTGNFFFDPSAFRTVQPEGPTEARAGTLGRNVFNGPGAANIDLSLLKRFAIGDRQRFELRLDATNVFNHAQFSSLQPGAAQSGNLFFGRATGTTGPRRVQFLLRYGF